MLAWHNRIAHDDYGVLLKVRHVGLLGAVADWYNLWSGRWAASWVLAALLQFYYSCGGLWTYSLLTLVLLFAASYQLVGNALGLPKREQLPKMQLWLFSGLFAISLFYLSFDVGETWFWVTGSVTYLWSVLAFMLGIGLVLSPKKSVGNWLGIAICFLFSGGSNEGFASVMLVLMAGLIILFLTQKSLPQTIRFKLIVATGLFFLAFVILVIAPGNMVRKEYFPEVSLWGTFKVALLSYKILLKEFVLPKLPYLLLFALPWVYVGNFFAKGSKGNGFKMLLAVIVFIGLLCFLSMLPTAYALVSLGPKRYLVQVSFYLALGAVSMGFCLGYFFRMNEKLPKGLAILSIVTIVSLNVYTLVTQYPIASSYSQAEDARIELLLAEKEHGRTESLSLNPLPPAGLLKSNELDTNTSHFTNTTMAEVLELGYPIRVKTWGEVKQ